MRVNKPNVRDVAKQAKVSVGTVSNVLNRPAHVSEETRQRVREAIDMLGFVPNAQMKNSNREPKVIGLILPLSDNPFYTELAQGVEDSVAKGGLRVLTGYSREDEAIELHLLTSMVDAGFKGVIVTPVGPRNQVFEKYIDQNIRVGYISQSDEEPEQCSVSIDQVRGGYIGLEYLHKLGHKDILWISGPSHHHQSNQRFVGITLASQEFDVNLQVMNSPSLDFISGEQIAPSILALPKLPDAIFAGNDALALGIINFLLKEGIKVPDQVSVLGYDNVAYAESALVPLSTVSQTPYQLGYTMGEQMLAELSADENHLHQHVVFQPQIVERSSTKAR
ncbi:PurR Transcriptional regulators [Candidatus Nanopelagicaceae bacterium]